MKALSGGSSCSVRGSGGWRRGSAESRCCGCQATAGWAATKRPTGWPRSASVWTRRRLRALIVRGVRQEPMRHERLRELYNRELRESEEASLPRQDGVNLTRFCTGHHPSLGRWRAMVGRTEDPTCRLCQMVEESSEHLWMECGALEALRRRHQLGS